MFSRVSLKAVVSVILLVVLVVALFPVRHSVEAERPDAPTYAMPGPYAVGTQELMIEDDERAIPVTIWYPATNPDAVEGSIIYSLGIEDLVGPALDDFTGNAILDSEPDLSGAPYPLVVNSHGTGASRFLQAYLCEHLASHGFVVMAPEHVGTAIFDYMTVSPDEEQISGIPAEDFIKGHYYRPSDMQRVIIFAADLTAPSGQFAGLIDVEHVAVSGYSGGGYTALASAGARLDFRALNSWCTDSAHSEETSPGYGLSCSLVPYEATLASLFNTEAESEDLWPAISDPHVDAVVVSAPGRVPAFGPDGLSALTVPGMILTGTNDLLDWQDDNAYVAYEHIGSAIKSQVVFEYGGHMIFGQCNQGWEAVAYNLCSDFVWDMDRAHDITNHFVTAFLMSVLYEDAEATAHLRPENVTFPGISYQTTIE